MAKCSCICLTLAWPLFMGVDVRTQPTTPLEERLTRRRNEKRRMSISCFLCSFFHSPFELDVFYVFPTQPKPITSFPTFQITITYTALHFFPNQFKENFRSVEQKRSIEAVGEAYLSTCLLILFSSFFIIEGQMEVQKGDISYQKFDIS